MKKLAVVLVGIMLCLLAACNKAEPPKIGVVDVVRAVNESTQGKKAYGELDLVIKAKQGELKEKADAVENLKKRLEKEPPAAKKAIEEELVKANDQYQQLAAASDAEVKKKAGELRNKVSEDLKKALAAIGEEDKFLLILTNENVAYYKKTIDITDIVIKKYNESTGGK
jgi:outer membrane protein